MLKYSIAIFVFLTAVMLYSCKDPISGQYENLPPNTNLSLFPDSTIAPGTTLKTIRWWGDDPDGIVKGFRISFDSIKLFLIISIFSDFFIKTNCPYWI